MDWIQKLKLLVNHYERYADIADPGFLYKIEKPEPEGWPSGIPANKQIEFFYSIFGGGEIGSIRINNKSNLKKETDSWFAILHDDEHFLSTINKDSSLAIGTYADGTPWFYDTVTDVVRSYYWKSGTWEEPLFTDLASFVEYLLTPKEGDADWIQVLNHAGINTL